MNSIMPTSAQNLEERQSVLIKAMRFPLICMVVFVHSPGTFPTQTVEWSLDGWNIYHFVSEMISGLMFSIATCWFFTFRGYLFFRNLSEGEFSFQWVTRKGKKRIRSLLIPYLIWNALAVIASFIVNGLFSLIHLETSSGNPEPITFDPLYWFVTGPADFPLWFLRDLIIVTLLLPIAYPLIKRCKWVFIGVLVAAYLSPLAPTIPSMRSFFFVMIGAWLGTYKINLISLCQKAKVLAAFAALILLIAATSQIGKPTHTFLLNLFHPFGMIVFLNICDTVISNNKAKDLLCSLSSSVFFIYAVHEIYILGWTKGLCLRLFGSSLAATWIRYWLLVLTFCLGLYYMLNRLMPRTLTLICGGRSK